MGGKQRLQRRGCTPDSPGNRKRDSHRQPGAAVPGVTIRIVDAQHQLLPEDTVVCPSQRPLMLEGYYNNPEANAECFLADGWMDTGDLGFLSGGALALTGRAKAMLTIHGRNFYSHEIEGWWKR
ncbi:MAG: AMP-binding protein [Candidatus Thiothrix singaporensis]|uniref:AMP-binding protein n=1 Tax=Candidatus Thiothrix singaporensis TaxID=2799669 RepID=A0A7L6ARL2_9GAMM|nr:MAG: AMP-binding protein [Candidatus Thiothrix singaporensis]